MKNACIFDARGVFLSQRVSTKREEGFAVRDICAAADICPMTRYEPKANTHLAAGLAFLAQNGFLRA